MDGALALLRRRPRFAAFVAGLALSYTGSGAALIALTLYVQQTHGTGSAVAWLLVAAEAPRLLGPLGGSLADRVDLRRLMVGADLGQAVLFGAMALLPSYGPLLALVVLTGLLQMTYTPARSSVVPALVEPDELLAANALVGTARNLYVAVGPLIGGLLFAIGGAAPVLLVNVVSFLASAWLTSRIPPLPAHERSGTEVHEPFFRAARTGLRFALADPITRTVTLTIFFAFSFLAIDNVAYVFLVRDTLGGGAAAYGIVSAAFGVGMILCSLQLARGSRLPPAVLYLGGITISSVGALLTGAAPEIAVLVLFAAVGGAGNGIEIVAGDTLFQQRVPPRLLGRVYGLTDTATAAGMAIAMALGGFLVDATSPRTAFFISGLGCLLVAACAAPTLLRARSEMIPR
jgi:MFS family permease